MAEHDDGAGSDPDRAAILARRQRFIALALSGLASTACTDGKSGEDKSSDGKLDTRSEPPPQPCLTPVSVDPPPQACLKMVKPPAETGGGADETGGTGESETGDEGETGKPETAPKPCLSKTAPQPCLRKAPAPQPCLKKPPPDATDL